VKTVPRFAELSKDLQLKVRQIEAYANELGKDSPECRELWLELQKETVICGALKRKDGVYSACLRSPVEGAQRCAWHGGNSLAGEERTPAQKLVTMKYLRPEASFVHGLYSEESTFVKSLTDEEIQFMAWLDKKVRENYEVEEGLGDVILEGLLHDAVLHFRLLNSGRLERGSKHTAKPLMDLMKACKEMGWTKKEKTSQNQSQSVLDAWLKKLDSVPMNKKEDNDEEEKQKPLN
jgi:hypothetical protein